MSVELPSEVYPVVIPATIPQLNYISSLLDQKEMSEESRRKATQRVAYTYLDELRERGTVPISKSLASEWIQRLKSLPPRVTGVPASVSTPAGFFTVDYRDVGLKDADGHIVRVPMLVGGKKPIPRGSYALRGDDPVNPIKFYQVWMSNENDPKYGPGKWNVRVCHGPESSDLRSKATQATIARRIAEDPSAAATLFGLEIGKCGICNRRLTNATSRAMGIGPICAGRYGW